jgi:hypothetical protein
MKPSSLGETAFAFFAERLSANGQGSVEVERMRAEGETLTVHALHLSTLGSAKLKATLANKQEERDQEVNRCGQLFLQNLGGYLQTSVCFH